MISNKPQDQLSKDVDDDDDDDDGSSPLLLFS